MIENIKDFKDRLSKLPNLSVVEEKNKLILNCERLNKSWEIEKSLIDGLIEKLKRKKIKDETILYDEYSYEALVKFETPLPILFRRFFEEDLSKEDPANGIVYELSKPTDEYLLFILDALIESEYWKDIFRFFLLRVIRERTGMEKTEFFEFLSKFLRIYTLKIRSREPMSSDRFSKLATSFLFNLSYNLDIAVIEVRFLHELARSKITRIRRSREIEPPRRIYNPDLVYHYQMAISTDSIPLQFLSFYHVIEHFFYDIYHEDLINTIKAKITSPDFSYKRKRDLENLIKLISQKIKYKDEELLYNEQEALYLTLKKYVRLDNLIAKLREYDESLIEYYQKNKVSFSKGASINFSLSDTENIFRQIADRIYKTRNSIVHSKEGGKPRYVPFRNDKELTMEIPLIRFIAEEIIINTSKVIE
ncbi:MAG: hypothetical protein MW690_001529 [Methanophagales archaeon]|nr:hypothetical protein [Methanophagales archaeon]MCU4139597.1 hypothetical protein [Methanophagales archaeon]